jgi:hypothetical protein
MLPLRLTYSTRLGCNSLPWEHEIDVFPRDILARIDGSKFSCCMQWHQHSFIWQNNASHFPS